MAGGVDWPDRRPRRIFPRRKFPVTGPHGIWQDYEGKLFQDNTLLDKKKEMRTRVVICHDKDSELLADSLQVFLRDYPELLFERHDVSNPADVKRARHILLKFGTKLVPFCGVLTGEKPVKGFYLEDGECTEELIKSYIREHYKESPTPSADLSFGEQLKMFFERDNDYTT